MSELNQSGTHPASGLRPGIGATVAGIVSRAMERWHRGQAAATLRRLDDRQLEDIGISRNDIPHVVAGLVPSKIETSTQDARISAHAARLLRAARLQ
ncbi:DUF1127 domain-containing protein [Mesorhizobium sp. CAU 1732]|uniref:DUF1127 domain-containing protein n=1 Tax=Mesorhizobium sp. CAU 1732 TaxID=3140358 RepID=UPI0032602662